MHRDRCVFTKSNVFSHSKKKAFSFFLASHTVTYRQLVFSGVCESLLEGYVKENLTGTKSYNKSFTCF